MTRAQLQLSTTDPMLDLKLAILATSLDDLYNQPVITVVFDAVRLQAVVDIEFSSESDCMHWHLMHDHPVRSQSWLTV